MTQNQVNLVTHPDIPKTEKSTNSRRGKYLLALTLLIVLFFIGHLFISYIYSIWDKSRVENTLSVTFQRKVHLGKIKWRIGFRGLAFDTDEIAIQDKDGTPCFHAKKTTILFGIYPLLRGQLRVKHLDMLEPETWFKRLTQTEWNFSDLPQADTFSKFPDCKVVDGRVFLIDERKPGNKNGIELKNIQFETHHTFGKYFWPFALSAQIDQPEGACTVFLTGTGSGSLNAWQRCHYNFDLKVNKFIPAKFSSFVDSLPGTDGCIDFEIKGSGTPTEQFNGNTIFRTDRFIIKPAGSKPIKILNASVKSQLSLDKKLMSWRDLNIKISGSEFKSTGKLDQWLSSAPAYEATIEGKMEKLEGILLSIDIPCLTSLLRPLPRDFACSGQCTLSGLIPSQSSNQKTNTDIVLHNVSIELKDRNFILNGIEGSIRSDEDGLHVKQIKASLNQGKLEGSAELTEDNNTAIKIKGKSIAIDDIKQLTAALHIPSDFDKLNIHGNIKTVDISISGDKEKSRVNFTFIPEGLVWQNHDQILKIIDGSVTGGDSELNLSNVKGTLGSGSFVFDGHIGLTADAPVNVVLTGQNLDLTSVRSVTQALGIQHLYGSLLSGKLAELKLSLQNSKHTNQLTLTLRPQDILYEPIDSASAIHLVGGEIKYENDLLTLSNVSVRGPATHCTANLTISHWASQPQIQEVNIDNANLDFKEISRFLLAKKNPPQLRQSFENLLDDRGISDLQGSVTGSIAAENLNSSAKIQLNCTINSVQFKQSGQLVHLQKGSFATNKNGDLDISNLSVSVNDSAFNLNGTINDFRDLDDMRGRLKIQGQLYFQNLATSLPRTSNSFLINKPLPVQALLPNWRWQNSGLMLGTSQVTFGEIPLQMAGTAKFAKTPNVDIKTWIHDPIAIQKIVDTVMQGQADAPQITGTVRGGMHIVGPFGNPAVTAGCRIFGGGMSKSAVSNVFGHIKLTFVEDERNSSSKNPRVSFNFDTISLGIFPITNLSGQARYALNETPPSVNIYTLKANIAGGTLNGSVSLNLNEQLPFMGKFQVKGIEANDFIKELGGKENELRGTADIDLDLNGNAASWQELSKSVSGSGSFQANNGHIDALRQLQIKLEEANVIEQGIVGFRVSNVLGIVDSKENGAFLSTSGRFKINKGLVQLQTINLEGEELKLKSAGTFDLNTKQVAIHTSGDIMHIGDRGALGKVASLTSVASLADLVSKEVRPTSPTPFSGHSFVFDISGDLSQPSTIDSSIAKSFHWVGSNPVRSVQK